MRERSAGSCDRDAAAPLKGGDRRPREADHAGAHGSGTEDSRAGQAVTSGWGKKDGMQSVTHRDDRPR